MCIRDRYGFAISETDTGTRQAWQRRQRFYRYLNVAALPCSLILTPIDDCLLYTSKSGDEFWTKAETLLYTALIGYIHYEAPEEEQNFATLIEFINAMEVREDDEEFQNPVDMMFEDLKKREPNHFAVRQYAKYKLAAGVVCSKRLLNQAVGKSLRTHNLKPVSYTHLDVYKRQVPRGKVFFSTIRRERWRRLTAY